MQDLKHIGLADVVRLDRPGSPCFVPASEEVNPEARAVVLPRVVALVDLLDKHVRKVRLQAAQPLTGKGSVSRDLQRAPSPLRTDHAPNQEHGTVTSRAGLGPQPAEPDRGGDIPTEGAAAEDQDTKERRREDRWYVPADEPDRWKLGYGGMPPLHLVPYGDVLRLCEDATGLLVGPTDRRLAALGIHSVKVRGVSYYPDAARAGDFTPGHRVALLRQPDHLHDPNAVAICAAGTSSPAGYVNKQKARLLARLLDSRVVLTALSVRGTPAGEECRAIGIVAAEPAVLASLLGPRPPTAPRPAGPGD